MDFHRLKWNGNEFGKFCNTIKKYPLISFIRLFAPPAEACLNIRTSGRLRDGTARNL